VGALRNARTIENQTDEDSGKIGLLRVVQIVWDLWNIGVIGLLFPLKRAGHDSDMYEGGRIPAEGGVEGKGGVKKGPGGR